MGGDKYVAVITKGTAYLSQADLAKELHYTPATIKKLVDGLREEIGKGRYHRCAIAGHRINFYALVDYMTYKDRLADKNMRKLVPPFDPAGIAELCGYNMKLIHMDKIEEAV